MFENDQLNQSVLFNKRQLFPTLNKTQSSYPELTFKSQIQLWLNNQKPSLWTKAGRFFGKYTVTWLYRRPNGFGRG